MIFPLYVYYISLKPEVKATITEPITNKFMIAILVRALIIVTSLQIAQWEISSLWLSEEYDSFLFPQALSTE